jgi:hypothetical protein
MAGQIPPPIQGQKYISLTTFRKNGVGVATPVWFGEADGKLYVMTRSDMGNEFATIRKCASPPAPSVEKSRERNSLRRRASCPRRSMPAPAKPSTASIGWRGFRSFGCGRIPIWSCHFLSGARSEWRGRLHRRSGAHDLVRPDGLNFLRNLPPA